MDRWNISGEQLNFLKNTIDQNADQVDNIFVFFHQLLWWTPDNQFKNFGPNSLSGRADKINFWNEVYPLFSVLDNSVYMFAGDCGANRISDSFMYYASENITFVASGMGYGRKDNFIITEVGVDKIRKFQAYRFKSR